MWNSAGLSFRCVLFPTTAFHHRQPAQLFKGIDEVGASGIRIPEGLVVRHFVGQFLPELYPF